MAGGVVVALVVVTTALAIPGFDRVERAADSVPLPADAQFRGEYGDGGVWCLAGSCPTVIRYYAVPDADVAKDWIGQALEDDGWNSQGPGPEFGWCRGDFCLVLRAWDERTAEGLPSTTSAPRGWETIEIDTRAWS